MAAGRTRGDRPKRRYSSRLPVEQRTEQLLDSALRLVAESGFGAVSMHAVARHSGVTRPVAYDCFAGRDDLLAALVNREQARMRAVFAGTAAGASAAAEPAAPDAPAEEGARRRDQPTETLRTFLTAVRDAPDTWRLLYTPPATVPDEPRQQLRATRAELLALLRTEFTGYAEAHGLPPDLDTDVAVHLLRAIVEMAGQRVLLDPDRYPPERMTAALGAVLDAFSPPVSSP